MGKYKAIPQGYMTVGEVAKKMNTTVRTLQYYDREGVFSPSAESGGKRRLYTDKDIVKLHQVQSMKYLGFSLDDIKNRLNFLDTPAGVADALTEHAATVRGKIAALTDALQAIEALKAEVLLMQSVDFKKYADIIINVQLKNEYYWLIKHFDDETLDYFRSRFDKDSALEMVEAVNSLLDKAGQYQKDGVPPESEEGQAFAKAFWEKMNDFTGGDMDLLPKLVKLVENVDGAGVEREFKKKQETANLFIEPALAAYFAESGVNPFEEAAQ